MFYTYKVTLEVIIRILIIDDDPDVRDTLSMMLRLHGGDDIYATDTASAQQAISCIQPTVVFSPNNESTDAPTSTHSIHLSHPNRKPDTTPFTISKPYTHKTVADAYNAIRKRLK